MGAPVRAVHPGRGGEPARVGARRAQRRRAGHPDRGEPADRRPVPPLRGGAGEGQPGRGGAADVGRRGARGSASRRTAGCSCTGTPTCASGTCSTAPTCRPARPSVAGRPARPRGGRHRRRRPRRRSTCTAASRSPVFNICDGLGPRRRRPARAHADRRAAVLRRRRQQLLDARHRRDRAAGPRGRPARFGFVGANGGMHEQVLGRRLLDHAGAVAGRPQRRPAGRARRRGRAVPSSQQADGWAAIETYTVRYAPRRPPHRASSSAGSRPTASRFVATGRGRRRRGARPAGTGSRSGSGSTCGPSASATASRRRRSGWTRCSRRVRRCSATTTST